ncbi:hypothetical protein ZWY2020_004858 [Hordeum vulgare]|nr:hypothetical protein ZWY2020_004858 [Hordeum vulgare]
MKKTVVLYPGLGVGHLVPMVEVAKLFLKHGLAVTMALVEPQVKSTDFSAAVARARASNPSVAFHVLPTPTPPPPADANTDGAPRHHVVKVIQSLAAMNAPLRDFLRSLPSVHALVLDMFCVDALDVAAELKLPVYYSFASGAGDLAIFLNLPSKFASNTAKVKELGDSIVTFPGVPPFKASELPSEVIGDGEAFMYLLRMFERMTEANGILINSLESLEKPAVTALNDGLCVTGRATPPVYCIGPLVSGGGDKEHDCLRWLDAQPDQSVVFLSFGSLGKFSSKQLEEIALGLDKSGERFLWVVRSPRSPDQKHGDPLPEPDLDALMPEGFLERTKDRGLVVKSWAPQVDVLRHRATGAFMTHCGWNSTLEGITAGLPLLCWPLYAEQRVNKVHIVDGMKLGVEMRGYNEEVVKAEEVEEKVRWVMASEGGKALRERVTAAKDAAADALKEGGSSYLAFVQFLNDMGTSMVATVQN